MRHNATAGSSKFDSPPHRCPRRGRGAIGRATRPLLREPLYVAEALEARRLRRLTIEWSGSASGRVAATQRPGRQAQLVGGLEPRSWRTGLRRSRGIFDWNGDAVVSSPKPVVQLGLD